jgi:hypothetical protein
MLFVLIIISITGATVFDEDIQCDTALLFSRYTYWNDHTIEKLDRTGG